MNTHEALGVLGLVDGVAIDEIRSTYRRLLLTHHPDVAGPAANAHTALLIEAYKVAAAASAIEIDVDFDVTPDTDELREELIEPASDTITLIGADTIAITAPSAESYAMLYEAASRVGEISYYDRNLGILETMLRFDGGPTCSLLMTLQGRAAFTEGFCTLELIEAAPAPPITSIIGALVRELRALT